MFYRFKQTYLKISFEKMTNIKETVKDDNKENKVVVSFCTFLFA